MQDQLFQWICDMREKNLRVSYRLIKQKAKALGKDDFKASTGWLTLFTKRRSLSLRRKTTVCRSTPVDVIPKLVSYIVHHYSSPHHSLTPISLIPSTTTSPQSLLPLPITAIIVIIIIIIIIITILPTSDFHH